MDYSDLSRGLSSLDAVVRPATHFSRVARQVRPSQITRYGIIPERIHLEITKGNPAIGVDYDLIIILTVKRKYKWKIYND